MTAATLRTRASMTVMAALLAATSALAADLDPTGQAGQYQTTISAVRVRGYAGSFPAVTIYAPFILPNDPAPNGAQAFLNAPQVQWVGSSPGGLVGAFTTYNNDPANSAAPRVVAVTGTTDAAGGGVSNNVILDEGPIQKSNALGDITKVGDVLLLERFGNGQNNIAYFPGITGVQPQTASPSNHAPQRIFSPSILNVGIGKFDESGIQPDTATVVGSVFLGSPSGVRTDPASLFESAVAMFNGLPMLTSTQMAACINGVVAYRGIINLAATGVNGDPWGGDISNSNAIGAWFQKSVPLPTNPPGASRDDARQTQPQVVKTRGPNGSSLEVTYYIHGVGFSGGAPFTGGSARPLYLAVSELQRDYRADRPVTTENTILIEADATGGLTTPHGRPYTLINPSPPGFADHWNSDPNLRFVDHTALGGAPDVSGVSHFDMNSKGFLVAIVEDTSVVPPKYQIRLYNPIWQSDFPYYRIAGFKLYYIVATSGDLDNFGAPIALAGARTTIEVTPGVFAEVPVPTISGVCIDDAGRVAFVGMTEKFEELGDWDSDPQTPDTLYLHDWTSALYVWEPELLTLHRLVRGGHNGDTLSDAFPGQGFPPLADTRLAIGAFSTDPSATDTLGRGGFSDTQGYLTVAFRSCGNQFTGGVNQELETLPNGAPDTFIDRGGALYAPGQLGVQEQAVRGTLVISLGQFTTGFVCCPGNADKQSPGVVNFNDITSVLANWGNLYTFAGTGPGDGDCDGDVDFADINAALANWLQVCP